MIELQDVAGYGDGKVLTIGDGQLLWSRQVVDWKITCSDRLTPIAAADDVMSDVVPFDFALDEIIAYLTNPTTTGTFTIDVKVDGVSIFSTLLTIDEGEQTNVTAAVAAVISLVSLAKGDEIVIDVTDDGDGTASGLILHLVGTRSMAPGADVEAPTTPTGLALTVISSTQINVGYVASSDNVGVTAYEIRVNGGAYVNQIINIGTSNPYHFTPLDASTNYIVEIRAKDLANNASGFSASQNATTDAPPFVDFYDTLDAKHTALTTGPPNGLKVTTVGESGYSVHNDLGINSDGDYVEFIWPTTLNWDIRIGGRAKVGWNNGAGGGVWYDHGTTTHEATFDPVVGDVYRVEKIAGDNIKIYQNGVLIVTTAYGDLPTPWTFEAKSYSAVPLNEIFAKPTVVS